MYSGTRSVAERLGLHGPLGCLDGSHVVEALTGSSLWLVTVLPRIVLKMLLALEQADLCGYVFASDRVFHDASGHRFLRFVNAWSKETQAVARLTEPDLWQDTARAPAGVVAVGPRSRLRPTARSLADEFADTIQVATFPIGRDHADATWGMVARASGMTKGTAAKRIAEHHGVALERTVVVGDWLNDIPMMEVVGRSFAMAQAPEAVSSRATDLLVASEKTGGGIAEACRRCGWL